MVALPRFPKRPFFTVLLKFCLPACLVLLTASFERAAAASVTITSSATSVNCSGTITLTATESGYQSGGTFTWYATGSNQTLATGSTYTPTVSGNTSYYATYTYYVLIIPNVINSNTINITVTPL